MADPSHIISVDYGAPIEGIIHIGGEIWEAESYLGRSTCPLLIVQPSKPAMDMMRGKEVSYSNLRLSEAVILDAGGYEIDFHTYSNEALSSPLSIDRGAGNDALVRISSRLLPVRTLDSLVAGSTSTFNVLNIGAPGSESRILLGAIACLQRIRYVYLSCTEKRLYRGQDNLESAAAILKALGFELLLKHTYSDARTEFLFQRRGMWG